MQTRGGVKQSIEADSRGWPAALADSSADKEQRMALGSNYYQMTTTHSVFPAQKVAY